MFKPKLNTSYHGEPGFRLLDSAFNEQHPDGKKRTHRLVSDPDRHYDICSRLWVPDPDDLLLVHRIWLHGVGCSHIVQDTATGGIVATGLAATEAGSWLPVRDRVTYVSSL